MRRATSTSTSGHGVSRSTTGPSRPSGVRSWRSSSSSPNAPIDVPSSRGEPMTTPKELPSRAEIVVIGGGIIGASVAYHLTKLGRADVVLLEQGRLSGGTTWHAAGLVGQLRTTESGTRLVQYSAQLY